MSEEFFDHIVYSKNVIEIFSLEINEHLYIYIHVYRHDYMFIVMIFLYFCLEQS